MGQFVTHVGRNIYIYVPDTRAGRILQEWALRYQDDVNFYVDHPFPNNYPNIFMIPSNGNHNMRRMSSQIGSELARHGYHDKSLRRRRVI